MGLSESKDPLCPFEADIQSRLGYLHTKFIGLRGRYPYVYTPLQLSHCLTTEERPKGLYNSGQGNADPFTNEGAVRHLQGSCLALSIFFSSWYWLFGVKISKRPAWGVRGPWEAEEGEVTGKIDLSPWASSRSASRGVGQGQICIMFGWQSSLD